MEKKMKKRAMNKGAGNHGFTLIEIMVVIVIIGILALAIVPNLIPKVDEARVTRAVNDIDALKTALKLYRLDNGVYPSTEQGLEALIEAPTVGVLPKKYPSGGYLEQPAIDPWGNKYIYISPGLHGDFDILSYGADGVPDGEDVNKDITSWDLQL